MHTKLYSKNVKGRDHLGDIAVGGGIIINCILDK
jgi:hypothetical protein